MTSRFAAAKPKRAGEEFARHHHNDDSSKKPRFDIRNPSALAPDQPEEDAVLEADVIGGSGAGTKRNAVNIDGYDSDSENEGFDQRAEARKGSKNGEPKLADVIAQYKGGSEIAGDTKDVLEEDADMFADMEEEFRDGDEDERVPGTGRKGKSVTFLEEHEIEGQVKNSKSGGHVSANFALDPKGKLSSHAMDDQESSEDESEAELARIEQDVDDEVGAGGLKGKAAPRIEAYNMKAEQEEGRFDDAGNFVRKAADPDAVHDNWLQGVSKKEIKKAAEAHEKREEARRQKDREDDALTIPDMLSALIVRLERGETVLEALARLGKSQKQEKRIPKWKLKKQKQLNGEMDVDEERAANDPEQKRITAAVEAITGAADQLLSRGQTDIYEQEREMLIRQYQRETGVAWTEPSVQADKHELAADDVRPTKMWQYRWTDGRDGDTIQGPFEGSSMVAWQDAGYFGEDIEFRRADPPGEWSRVVEFL